MVQINFALKEVNCKIVYYGPGLSGKTTNLEVVHSKAPSAHVGELTSIATEGDRTLFFDFLPLNLGQVAGMTTKFQLYTVPGQVYYNSTRKLVLQGADGIVFVADSRRGKMDENIESLDNLEENLREYGMDIRTIPLVMQYNKRDLPDIYTIEELEEKLNRYKVPYFEAVAVTGEGVFPTLKKLSSMVLESLNRQQGSTVVKMPRKARQPVKEREAVVVGAPAGGASKSTAQRPAVQPAAAAQAKPAAKPAAKPQAARKAPQGAKPAATRAAPARAANKAPPRPAERKPVAARRPAADARPRPARQGAGAARPVPVKKKSKAGLVCAVILVLLGAAGAALYFTGVLDSLLK